MNDAVFDAAGRVNATVLADWIIKGAGRRVAPKAIYAAAWEVRWALKREAERRKNESEKVTA